MVQEEITQERLKQILDYNPETGVFSWKISPARPVKVGSIAGRTNTNGYRSIKINNKSYLAHRLAWIYVYGKWPEKIIDHINRKKDDNRISNLRDVNHAQNNSNRIGIRGYQKEGEKFRARMSVDYKIVYLGSFDTAEDAKQAYLVAKKQLHFS